MKDLPTPKTRPTLSQRAAKWLVCFFILMLLLTILSRIVDSMLIPTVSTANLKRKALEFFITGSGTIDRDVKIPVYPLQGLRVDKVMKVVGEPVGKDDPLFQYNMEDLNKQIQKKQEEIREAENSLKKLLLSSEKETLSGNTDTAQKRFLRAQEDYNLALSGLEEAQKDYDSALEKATNTDKKQQTEKEKQQTEKEKQESELLAREYEEAKLNYEITLQSNEELLRSAQRIVTEISEKLDQQRKKDSESKYYQLHDLITVYKEASIQSNYILLSELQVKILELYFGKEEFENYQNQSQQAVTALSDARAQLNTAREKWEKIISSAYAYMQSLEPDSPEYQTAKKEYESAAAGRDQEVAALERAVKSAVDIVDRSQKKRNEIETALYLYRSAITAENTEYQQECYQKLVTVLGIDQSYDDTESKDLEKKLKIAQEDFEYTKQKCDVSVARVKEKQDKAWTKLQSFPENAESDEEPFDYETALKSAEQAIDAAKGQITAAGRVLEDAEESLKNEKERISTETANASVDNRLLQMDLELYRNKIQQIELEIASLQEIVDADGIVRASADGVIAANDLSENAVANGMESIIIGTDGYIFTGKLNKTDKKRIQTGDTVYLTIEDKKKIKTQIISLGTLEKEGFIEFTAIIPDTEGQLGINASYEISKKSNSYDSCVPVQALHMDSKGFYLLIIQENESILGKELTTRRMNVDLLDQDSNLAAVSGSLTEIDNIIVSYSRRLEEGDRVRIN